MFYAHSGKDNNHKDWQLLADHCNKVGSITSKNANWFGAQSMAELIGKLHELGKYSESYQNRLHGGSRVDHATAGAKIAMEKWYKNNPLAKLMAYCIAGHHAGLANGIEKGDNRSTLESRLALEFGRIFPYWTPSGKKKPACQKSFPRLPFFLL